MSGGGVQCHIRLLVLEEGWDEGNTTLKCYTYIRSVLIFSKQYSDSMCFCSIFS